MANLSEREKGPRRIGRIQGFIGGVFIGLTLANTGIEAKIDSLGEAPAGITLSDEQYITKHDNVINVFKYPVATIPIVKTTRTNLTEDGSEISGVSIGGDIYNPNPFSGFNKYHQIKTEDGGILYKDNL